MESDHTDTLDVTGINPWVLLVALYEGSRVAPTALCRALSTTAELTPEAAKAENNAGVRNADTYPEEAPFYADYLFGRPIKVGLKKDGDRVLLTRAYFYDRDVGSGACLRVVDSLKAGGCP
tara:strand:+ start:93 stop:455 length:363 start_codon:yes stop_codon:yes gene_type:complete